MRCTCLSLILNINHLTSIMAMQITAVFMSLMVVTSLAERHAGCPGAVGDNWIQGSGRCFKYFGTKMSFNRAQEKCASMGFAGKLAFLDSPDAIANAKEAVIDLLGDDTDDHPTWLWVGITDEGNEDNWRSVDGIQIKKEQINFLPGHPNNAGRREHYLLLRTDTWQLNDIYETYSAPFICQVEPAKPDEYQCPRGWQRRGEHCYKFIDSALTFTAAQQRCESLGNDGSLVDIPSGEVNEFITNLAKGTGSWIGLEDRCHEDEWSNAYGQRNKYTNFAAGQPDDMRGEDCVQFAAGQKVWNDIGCESLLKFVCQRSAFFSSATAPEGWIRKGNNFFKFVRQRTTFLDAAARCQDLVPGAMLPSVRNQVDFDKYYTVAAKSAGGECSSEFRNFWTGISHPVEFPGNVDQETPVANMLETPLTARFIRVQPTTYYGYTSMRMELLSDCKAAYGENIRGLGLEDNSIPDYRITASSIHDSNHGAANARLNRKRQSGTTGAWSSRGNTLDQWIQVDLGCQQLVSGVVTQGRNGHGQWVKTYKVQVSNDGQDWSFVQDKDGQAVDFNGNFDMDTHVANKFDKPVVAQFVRIAPTTWHGYISMRFEVLGLGECKADAVCRVGLGVENHQIPDNQITASSEHDVNHRASFGRLNRPKIVGAGSWSAKRNDQYQWLQVDLGSVKSVTGVVTQGRADSSQWVKTFKVQYSMDGTTFNFIKNKDGANAQFNGNFNRFTPVANYFGSVKARFVRVLPTSWQSHISMRMEVLGDGECYSSSVCSTGLGIENNRIADNEITASTIFDANHGTANARLNRPKQGATTGAWSAKINDQNQWIQADLGVTKLVSGVITQGRNGWTGGQWVTKYGVEYSEDGKEWSYVQQQDGENANFNGNWDDNSPVRNIFRRPVRARFVRIRPTAWHQHISLRFEVLGCDAGPICRNFGLGLQNGRIPDPQITASTEFDANHGPAMARLNRVQSGHTRGGWSAKTNDVNQWIQADLGGVKLVTGVVTQGRNDYSQWVKSFNVEYSVDGEEFKFVQDGGQNVLFNGNTDRYKPNTNMFSTPLRAKVIRIRPKTWQSHISMRFEVLGCDGNEAKSCSLGMADGRIRDDQITSSTQHSAPTGSGNARLYQPKGLYEAGSWIAGRNDKNQWLQVDLGSPKVITGLVTQGRSNSEPYKQWVTAYFVQYSNDGEYWQYVEDREGGKAVGQMMVKGEKTRSFATSGYADAYLCQLPANIPLVEECICPIVECPLCPFPEPCEDCPEPPPCPDVRCPEPPECPECAVPEPCVILGCPLIACPDPEPCLGCPISISEPCPEIACPIPLPCPEIACPVPIIEPCPECPDALSVVCPLGCPVVDPLPCPVCPTPKPEPEPEPSLCPADWVDYDGTCYQLVKKKKLNWAKAKDACEKKGGYLASFNDFSGDKSLSSVKALQKSLPHKGVVWVGVSKDTDGDFAWLNGNKFKGKINTSKGDASTMGCATFKRGKFAHADCTSKRAYVCMMDIVRALPVIEA